MIICHARPVQAADEVDGPAQVVQAGSEVSPAGYSRTVSTPVSRQVLSRARTMSSVPISVVASTISSAPWQMSRSTRVRPAWGQPGVQMGEVGGGPLGDEAGAQPAVGDLTGQLQHLRRQRGQVNGHGAGRQADPQRPALAAGPRDTVLEHGFHGARVPLGGPPPQWIKIHNSVHV